MDELQLAEEALLEAASINEDERVIFHLGVVYDRTGRGKQAESRFLKCIDLNPRHAAAHNYLGYTWADRGINLEKAEEHILKALEIEPVNPAYLDSLGWAYYRQNRYKDAVEKLSKAAEMSNDPLILEHLGDAYMKLDDIGPARRAYEKSLEILPDNDRVKEKLENIQK